jgi:4-amino-4-deoxy-L-arabinose transferase-like glycosyltransferase
MKNKILILSLLLFSLLLSFSHIYKTFQTHRKALEDYTPTSLPERLRIPMLQGKRLLADKKYLFVFDAQYNQLGTIAVLFDKPKGYSGTLNFRIKESASDTWYYENTYQAHTINEHTLFTFGFPPIVQSAHHSYTIEFMSIQGTEQESLSFHPSSDTIIAKYSYPKSYLMNHNENIYPFIKNRINIYLSYISPMDILYALLLFLSPALCVILTINFWRLSKFLDNNVHFITHMDRILPIILFFLTLVLYGSFSRFSLDTAHDGAMFKPAMDVANGNMLFRDTFYQYGAFTALIQASALLIFGKYLITIKLLTVFVYGCTIVLLYYICRKFLPRAVSFSLSLIWICMAPYFLYESFGWTYTWSSVYALFFQLLTSVFLIRYFESKHKSYIIGMGIATSLTFWCRQPVGIFLFMAILSFYSVLYKSGNISKENFLDNIFYFFVGNSFISVIFMVWIIVNNAFLDWFRQSILFAFSFGQDRGSGYGLLAIIKTLFVVPSKSVVSVWFLIPFATIFLSIRSLTHVLKVKNSTHSKILLALTFIGYASWLQYFPYNDPAHAFWGSAPMTPLLAYVIYQCTREYVFQYFSISSLTQKYCTIAILFFFFLPDISFRMHDAIKKIHQKYYVISEPSVLRNILLTKEEKDWNLYVYNHIESYFSKNPTGNVTTNSPESLYLTFDQRIKNYHPVYMDWGEVVNHTIYPDYVSTKNTYIQHNLPFLISYYEILPEGYCRVDDVIRKDSLFLATPCQFLTAQ